MAKARLMYCCQSGLSAADLQRSFAMARELADEFAVTLLVDETDDTASLGTAGIDVIRLPKLGVGASVSASEVSDSTELRATVIARRSAMLAMLERLRPRVLVIEKFPFADRAAQGAILPLAERAQNGCYGETLVVCVTDGIFVEGACREEQNPRSVADLIDRYFDLVIVRSDPLFLRLDEFFQPGIDLATPFYHAGFILGDRCPGGDSGDQEENAILVNAGDSEHGMLLCAAAVNAYGLLQPSLGLPMKILAGTRLSGAEWRELRSLASGLPGLTLSRDDACLTEEALRARCLVSHCSYSAAACAVGTRVPALFVPCPGERCTEQSIRARRLLRWGVGRLLMPQYLNATSLAIEIKALLDFEPKHVHFDLNGAYNAASLIARVVQEGGIDAARARPGGEITAPRVR